jgi:4-nitrophenyl phosphatase
VIDFANKKFILLDLDGTLYAGRNLFACTDEFLKTVRTTGRRPVFLTNNSSRSRKAYMEKLGGLGIAENIEEIYTSGTATIEYLKMKGLKKIFLMATPSATEEYLEAGLELTEHDPQAVVLTFDKTFTYEKFCKGHDLINAGVPFYATHPDNHVPLENGKFHPDIGTFIRAFHTSTGKWPFVVGKPEKPIYEQLRARLECGIEEMVMVGDRLSTDILGANNYGMESILVLSGETDRAMLESAPKEQQPTMVAEDVGSLIEHLNGTL